MISCHDMMVSCHEMMISCHEMTIVVVVRYKLYRFLVVVR